MILKCKNKRCQHEWNYKGLQPFYTTCPMCRYKVPINRTPEEAEVIMKWKRGEDTDESKEEKMQEV